MSLDFHEVEVLPGVFHIGDPLGVYMTLLAGTERALLVDAGYGLRDAAAFVRSLTALPLTLLLTHGHHDHALGAIHFERALAFPEEAGVLALYTGEAQRRRVLASAAARGLPVDEAAFLAAPLPPVDFLPGDALTLPLGGLTAEIYRLPGHTPGSAVVYVPERRLLLSGDDWNPVTWLWFPEALPADAYRENFARLLALPFTAALCAHRPGLFPRAALQTFFDGLTDEALSAARPCGTGAEKGIDTAELRIPRGAAQTPAGFSDDWAEQILVFDRGKWGN